MNPGPSPLRRVLGSEDLASTIDTLQKRISAFQAQAEVAASTDNPAGELRRSRRLLPLIGYPRTLNALKAIDDVEPPAARGGSLG